MEFTGFWRCCPVSGLLSGNGRGRRRCWASGGKGDGGLFSCCISGRQNGPRMAVLRRFHKGAFYLAEELKMPIQPLLIHGASDAIPKGTFYVNSGHLTLKFLPVIEADDKQFGETYSERTKNISKYFKQEYKLLAMNPKRRIIMQTGSFQIISTKALYWNGICVSS